MKNIVSIEKINGKRVSLTEEEIKKLLGIYSKSIK